MLRNLRWLLVAPVLVFMLLAIVFFEKDRSHEALWERFAYSDSRSVELNEMPVHYRILGQGKPLLLLHGTGASLHTWDGWMTELQDSFQLIAVDLPAFGLTGPHPERDYSIPAYVDFVKDVVDELALDSFALAGNSLGGLIAWAYTAKHPEKVTELVLLDAAGLPGANAASDKPPLPMRLAQNPLTAAMLKWFTPRFIIKNSLLDVYADDTKVTDELVDRYFEMSLREGNRQAFIDRSNTSTLMDTSLLRSIYQPTLILWGAQDQWIPLSDATRFANLLPNDTLMVLEEVGHVPMEEVPSETAQIAREWLNKNTRQHTKVD